VNINLSDLSHHLSTHFTFAGHTGFYLSLLIFVSVLLCLAQSAFQIFLAVVGNEFVQKCEFLEILLRHVGLVRLDELDAISITQYLAPEVISFVSSIVIFIVLRKSTAINVENLNGIDGGDSAPTSMQPILPETEHEFSLEKWKVLVQAGKILSLLALCTIGAIQPSVLSVVYYIVFLGAATWWGCNKQLER
jgi:piezo-type mechanosensitive ion channel component 1/2